MNSSYDNLPYPCHYKMHLRISKPTFAPKCTSRFLGSYGKMECTHVISPFPKAAVTIVIDSRILY